MKVLCRVMRLLFLTWLFRRGRPPDRWAQDHPLFRVSRWDALTQRELLENTLAFGRTGAGKTSCMAGLIDASIQDGWGGVFFTVKVDDPDYYRRLYRGAKEK
ncbi:hypothetical protein [Paludisphaera rhizosphaerae]|uniref:hypothetical protein n=1 Tax=Paludisphaera rhizosphaerae TaxID=2711216 RepID=UPI0013EA3B9F|nr:hypothetical protein [Paludisphaera rhizosphaerae]